MAGRSDVVMRLVPEDDCMHALEAAPNFNESMHFNVFDRANRLGGWFRIANRPNEGKGEMTCCVYLPDGRVGSMFGGEPVHADGSAVEQQAEESFARGHTEQHTRGPATLKVGDQMFAVDGLTR